MRVEEKIGAGAVHEARLKKLLDFCELLSTQIEYPPLLDTVLRETANVLDAEATSVLLYERGTDSLAFQDAIGEASEKVKRQTLRRDEGIAGKCFVSERPVIVNDVSREAGHAKRIDVATGFQTRSLLAVPIRLHEGVIGVLELVNKRSPEGFSEEDANLASAAAGIIACAIERTRLVQENLEKMRLATIGETVSGLAHCIKNILNGFKGGAFITEKGLEQEDLEKVSKGWRIVGRNIERITALAMDMLSFCKAREPEYAVASINEVIREAVDMIREPAAKHGITVRLRLADALPDFPFDARSIHRCLLNLLSNGVDALAEKDGERLISVESEERPGEVHLFVRDNGCGMDGETMRRAFGSFFSTKGSRGTGLGLPVSQKIISEHGGSLECSSRPGEGTTYSIRLPLQHQGGT